MLSGQIIAPLIVLLRVRKLGLFHKSKRGKVKPYIQDDSGAQRARFQITYI